MYILYTHTLHSSSNKSFVNLSRNREVVYDFVYQGDHERLKAKQNFVVTIKFLIGLSFTISGKYHVHSFKNMKCKFYES